ncbi:hypothetical protein [Rhizobium leguminosarum]|nr:hypothetical protein [Rhizobium leguminosarum]
MRVLIVFGFGFEQRHPAQVFGSIGQESGENTRPTLRHPRP